MSAEKYTEKKEKTMETKKGSLSFLVPLVGYLAVLALVLGGRCLVSFASAAAEVPAVGIYPPGTYTASAAGFGGDVTVTLKIGPNGGIDDVTLDGPNETPTIGGQALPTLREQVLAAQSAEIDGVSGASLTTGAVKEATAAAIDQAMSSATPVAVN